MAKHNELGKEGEAIALKYLLDNGYEILEKNFRHLKAEVDIIALKNNELIFVEVKTRSTDYFGEPAESVTRSKQRLMAEAADFYVVNKKQGCEVRYDIISIVIKNNTHTLHHIRDAFYPFASDLE